MNPVPASLETHSPKSVSETVLNGVADLLVASRVPMEALEGSLTGDGSGARPEFQKVPPVPSLDFNDPGWLRDAVGRSSAESQAALSAWQQFLVGRTRPMDGAVVCEVTASESVGEAPGTVPEAGNDAGNTVGESRVWLAPVLCGVDSGGGSLEHWSTAIDEAVLRLACLGGLPVAVVLHGVRSLSRGDVAQSVVEALTQACHRYRLDCLALSTTELDAVPAPETFRIGIVGIPPKTDAANPVEAPGGGDAVLLLGGSPEDAIGAGGSGVGEPALPTTVRMLVHGGRIRRAFPVAREGVAVALGVAHFDPTSSRWKGAELSSPEVQPPTPAPDSAPVGAGNVQPQPPMFPLEDFFNPRFAGCVLTVVAGLDAAKVLVQARLLGVGAIFLGRIGGDVLRFQSGDASRAWDESGNPITAMPPIVDADAPPRG